MVASFAKAESDPHRPDGCVSFRRRIICLPVCSQITPPFPHKLPERAEFFRLRQTIGSGPASFPSPLLLPLLPIPHIPRLFQTGIRLHENALLCFQILFHLRYSYTPFQFPAGVRRRDTRPAHILSDQDIPLYRIHFQPVRYKIRLRPEGSGRSLRPSSMALYAA